VVLTNQSYDKSRVPPIFISNQNLNYKLLCESLVELVGENGFYSKTSQKNIKFQANTSDDYRKIIHFLNGQSNAQFHTFQLNSEKPHSVVICNLNPSSTCEDIKSALENFNPTILQIVNVRQRHIKILLPLFFVDLPKDENCKTIFDITSIFHTKIKVEEPHKRYKIVQCHNFQDYGHTRAYCNYTINYTCALCQGNHPSNYRGSQIHKQPQNNATNQHIYLLPKMYTNLEHKLAPRRHSDTPKPQPLTHKDLTLK